jgi:hypothetical protein
MATNCLSPNLAASALKVPPGTAKTNLRLTPL